MPWVPITPTRPERVFAAAVSAPGATTPITGIESCRCSVGSAAALAVLQATTSSLMSRSTRNAELISE